MCINCSFPSFLNRCIWWRNCESRIPIIHPTTINSVSVRANTTWHSICPIKTKKQREKTAKKRRHPKNKAEREKARSGKTHIKLCSKCVKRTFILYILIFIFISTIANLISAWIHIHFHNPKFSIVRSWKRLWSNARKKNPRSMQVHSASASLVAINIYDFSRFEMEIIIYLRF